ncbi:hypothetical protein [Archangium sp.]|uniref:hypothetical protein n=1 Tax=Archangium sp. TaxID=1872627 RepID=UPI002D3AFDB2|nr:hypothetical protein [Archangium sp.]HYO54252.1 hypothetical protein [Archangium sp.]
MTRSTFSSHVEVYGKSVQALVNAMEFLKLKAQRVLATHGIEQLEPEKWYPMPRVIASFEDILEQVGPHTTRAIGRAVPKNAVFPPGIDSFGLSMNSLDQAYRMNHRGTGDIGSYRYQPEGDHNARMVCDNPYPCEFDQGIMEALYDRFPPRNSIRLRIDHDPSGCREKGARSCTYYLKW